MEKIRYCTDIMKQHFNKDLVVTKKTIKILKTLLNVGFVIMFMLKVMLK